jgi:dihydroxyacetone kinase-like protein
VSDFSVRDLRTALEGMIARTRECEEELNALDAELGDGDLGSTLVSVAGAIEGSLPSLPDELSAALTQLSRVIGGVSGSSFTSLLIVGLSKAGSALSGKSTLDHEDRARLCREALSAMLAASGSRLGDKTMLDLVASIAHAEGDADLVEVARRTLETYLPKPCRAGRARLAAESSVGRNDPGMVAMLRWVEGATGQRVTG